MLTQELIQAGPIDLSAPVERLAALNRARLGWWLALPGTNGGTTLRDLQGRFPAALTGTNLTWLRSDRDWGPALSWTGTTASGLVTCTGAAAKFGATKAVTVAAWIKMTGTGGGTFGRIIDEAAGGNLLLCCTGTGTQVRWRVNGSAPGECVASLPGLNQWCHLAGTYNGVDTRLYINGLLAAGPTAYAVNLGACTNLLIGNSAAATRNWEGQIRDVSLWSRPLSATEIALLYRDSANGYPATLRRSAGLVQRLALARLAGTWAAAPTPTLTLSPGAVHRGTTSTVTFTGTNTTWLSGAPTFTPTGVDGVSCGAVTVISNTLATAPVTYGTNRGTVTWTDSTTSATVAQTVTSPRLRFVPYRR